MPFKQKKPCAYPGCPELTHGKYCEKHQQQANRDYDRHHRTEENYSRYHNSRWKEIRSAQLHRQPLCEMCKKEGRYVAATLVHHIIPLSEGGANAADNLMSLCVSCHGKIHSARGDSWHNTIDTGNRKNAGEGDNHHDE